MPEGDPVVVVLVAAAARGGGEDGSTRAAAPSGRRVAFAAAKLRDFAARARSGVWNLERKQMGGTQRAGGKARTPYRKNRGRVSFRLMGWGTAP